MDTNFFIRLITETQATIHVLTCSVNCVVCTDREVVVKYNQFSVHGSWSCMLLQPWCEAKKLRHLIFNSFIKLLSFLIIFLLITLINFSSVHYFIFVIKWKTGNQLKIQTVHCASTLRMHNCWSALSRDVWPNPFLPNIPNFNPVDYKSWQCYRSKSVNSLCEISMNWGDIQLTAFSRSSLRSNWPVVI